MFLLGFESFAHERLNAPEGFLASLVPKVVDLLGSAFPEVCLSLDFFRAFNGVLRARAPLPVTLCTPCLASQVTKDPNHVMEVLNDEDKQFRRTLNRGKKLFLQAADKATDGVIDGRTAWRLWDTYGFPVDLTSEFFFLSVFLCGRK